MDVGENRLSCRAYGLLILFALAIMLPGLFNLPPIDRDEPRFAQASKQMIERGDYIDIYFQADPRYKKPVGIYWLQSASARLFGAKPYDDIWPYRLPSLLGALIAVLVTGWGVSRLTDARTGFMAGIILACGALLNFEARVAKTDAALLAAVTAAQFILAQAYAGRASLSRQAAMLFWVAQAAGILIKGPIAPFVSALTVGTLWIADRKIAWFKQLHPVPGFVLCLALVAPWLIWVGISSHGAFYAESAGHDFLGKIFTAQERNFLPPGYYATLFTACFAPFAWPALRGLAEAWRARRIDPAMRFALAWIVPAWLIYEIVFTKLPHYILPLYPAMAWLTARHATRTPPEPCGKLWRIASYALGAVTLGTMVVAAILPILLHEPMQPVPLALILGAMACTMRQAWLQPRRTRHAMIWGAASSALFMPAVFALLLPAMRPAWISSQAAEMFADLRPCAFSRLITTGYNEPSLVFLAGTDTLFANGTFYAAKLLTHDPCAIVMIDDRETASFAAGVRFAHGTAWRAGGIRGYNYNGGGWQDFSFYRRDLRPTSRTGSMHDAP